MKTLAVLAMLGMLCSQCSREEAALSRLKEFENNLAILIKRQDNSDPEIAERAIRDAIALCEKSEGKLWGADLHYIKAMHYGRLAFLQHKNGKEADREISLSNAVESFKKCHTVDGITTREKAVESFREFESVWESDQKGNKKKE